RRKKARPMWPGLSCCRRCGRVSGAAATEEHERPGGEQARGGRLGDGGEAHADGGGGAADVEGAQVSTAGADEADAGDAVTGERRVEVAVENAIAVGVKQAEGRQVDALGGIEVVDDAGDVAADAL